MQKKEQKEEKKQVQNTNTLLLLQLYNPQKQKKSWSDAKEKYTQQQVFFDTFFTDIRPYNK